MESYFWDAPHAEVEIEMRFPTESPSLSSKSNREMKAKWQQNKNNAFGRHRFGTTSKLRKSKPAIVFVGPSLGTDSCILGGRVSLMSIEWTLSRGALEVPIDKRQEEIY